MFADRLHRQLVDLVLNSEFRFPGHMFAGIAGIEVTGFALIEKHPGSAVGNLN